MPRGGEGGKRVAPPAGGGVGIDALPDEILQHILGFLEAPEAVRTCVLARRWRHLWKSAAGLRIVASADLFLGSAEKLHEFVDHLLPLRQGSPLDTCDLRFSVNPGDVAFEVDYMTRSVNTLFWYAVKCKAQVLRLRMGGPFLELDDIPIYSQRLTRLKLHGVMVFGNFLNFTSCPTLEHLEFYDCNLQSPLTNNILSESLKHLSITFCELWDDSRIRICAPNLVSLHLDQIFGLIPVLESMPSLVEAFAGTTIESQDSCDCLKYPNCEFCDDSYSIDDGTDSHNSVLLKGLSEAMTLSLISVPKMFIFKMDLRCCPMFSKLKTLLLNDYWCVPDDFRALVCILEHSPVLERLTLELSSECQTDGRISCNSGTPQDNRSQM